MSVTNMRPGILVGGFMLVLLVLNGCGDGPTPTLAAISTPVPTHPQVTTVPSRSTPATTETALMLSPAPTISVRPSQTATTRASRGATATVRPPASSTPARASATTTTTTRPKTPTAPPDTETLGGPDFPPDINPLTGLQVSDVSVLERCPLAIKVSNSPVVVRPQVGLDKADLVFEHYAEGGVTRLTAVYLGQTPTVVGSVRSGRLIDLEIPAMYHALFAYSGTSAGVGQKYAASDLWPDQLARPGSAGGAFYRRDLPKAFEHTLFVNPTTLWAEADQRGISERRDLRGLTFDPSPPAGGTRATDISILYRAGASQVEWIYNANDAHYHRWQGGTAHLEELTGAQLSTANVIVVSANHVETDIVEDTWGGGHWSIEIQIWGEGPASIFRDGRRYDGIWRRQDRHEMLSFWTADGSRRIPLKPGSSWLQMVPLGFSGLEVSP